MRQPPEQQAPPVQWLRLRYAKRDRMRFTSHRDFSRAFERAVVRAGLPMAYSSGFSPHPRISYAGASPTGASSEAEYLEIGLARVVDPDAARTALDDALPAGLDVLAAIVSPGGSLTDLLEASVWRISVPGLTDSAADAAVAAFLASPEILVERMTKGGLRRFDCREAVLSLTRADGTEGQVECAIIEVVLRHGVPSVRPDDVLAGLRETGGLGAGAAPLFERLAQGPLDPRSGTVGDPLASDRDTA
ncbi:MAG: TIGR03936 family radical SAM-associated protein [Nocardioidaceae bacterium]